MSQGQLSDISKQDVFVFKNDALRHFLKPDTLLERTINNPFYETSQPKFTIRRRFLSEQKKSLVDVDRAVKKISTPMKVRPVDVKGILWSYSPVKTEGTTIESSQEERTIQKTKFKTEECTQIADEVIFGESVPRQETKNVRRNNFRVNTVKQKQQPEAKKVMPLVSSDQQSFPITSEMCQIKFAASLTSMQKDQLMNFPIIYYMGKRRIKVQKMAFDIDDEHGDLKVYTHDHIAYRYEVLSIIGKGSFGQVFKAYDHKNKEEVALKIVKSKTKYTSQAVIEARILNQLKAADQQSHYNIVRMKESCLFRGHMCMAFQLLHCNLYEFLKLHKFKGFSLQLIHRIAIQILQALLLLSKNKIIHCDIKPQNIMLRQQNKSGIRLIDLGSSCYSNQIAYTYIQSRYYRAPQVILGVEYSTAIDMWSFGCVLYELYTGVPIFPGENQIQQVGMMVQLLGRPPHSLLSRSRRKKFFEDNGDLKNIQDADGHMYELSSRSLAKQLSGACQQFIQFVSKCLVWEPLKRITPEEALLDIWIVQTLPGDVRARHLEQMKIEAPELFCS